MAELEKMSPAEAKKVLDLKAQEMKNSVIFTPNYIPKAERVIYVSESGCDCNDGLSMEKPIKTLEKVNEITREERRALVHLLKNLEVGVSGFYTLDSAIITRGGINVKEIDPKTMRSKIVDNLFFAGEIIDVDAYTGGFNLQIAFSTGRLCGENM